MFPREFIGPVVGDEVGVGGGEGRGVGLQSRLGGGGCLRTFGLGGCWWGDFPGVNPRG